MKLPAVYIFGKFARSLFFRENETTSGHLSGPTFVFDQKQDSCHRVFSWLFLTISRLPMYSMQLIIGYVLTTRLPRNIKFSHYAGRFPQPPSRKGRNIPISPILDV